MAQQNFGRMCQMCIVRAHKHRQTSVACAFTWFLQKAIIGSIYLWVGWDMRASASGVDGPIAEQIFWFSVFIYYRLVDASMGHEFILINDRILTLTLVCQLQSLLISMRWNGKFCAAAVSVFFFLFLSYSVVLCEAHWSLVCSAWLRAIFVFRVHNANDGRQTICHILAKTEFSFWLRQPIEQEWECERKRARETKRLNFNDKRFPFDFSRSNEWLRSHCAIATEYPLPSLATTLDFLDFD